jgi:hypothetical protein
MNQGLVRRQMKPPIEITGMWWRAALYSATGDHYIGDMVTEELRNNKLQKQQKFIISQFFCNHVTEELRNNKLQKQQKT